MQIIAATEDNITIEIPIDEADILFGAIEFAIGGAGWAQLQDASIVLLNQYLDARKKCRPSE